MRWKYDTFFLVAGLGGRFTSTTWSLLRLVVVKTRKRFHCMYVHDISHALVKGVLYFFFLHILN